MWLLNPERWRIVICTAALRCSGMKSVFTSWVSIWRSLYWTVVSVFAWINRPLRLCALYHKVEQNKEECVPTCFPVQGFESAGFSYTYATGCSWGQQRACSQRKQMQIGSMWVLRQWCGLSLAFFVGTVEGKIFLGLIPDHGYTWQISPLEFKRNFSPQLINLKCRWELWEMSYGQGDYLALNYDAII